MTQRSDGAWETMVSLSERLLVTTSATAELECWCRERGLGEGNIVAMVDRNAARASLDDEARDVLHPMRAPDTTRFRRVRLVTGNLAVVDALNWYFPGNLSADICRQLETTSIPFGHAIRCLKPRRRTYLVRRCTPEHFTQAWQSGDRSWIAFEHRAVVLEPDGTPLAVVHERFRAVLLGANFTHITTHAAHADAPSPLMAPKASHPAPAALPGS